MAVERGVSLHTTGLGRCIGQQSQTGLCAFGYRSVGNVWHNGMGLRRTPEDKACIWRRRSQHRYGLSMGISQAINAA